MLQLSQNVMVVMVVLQLSRDELVVLVVLQFSQDLLVDPIMVHQQPPSAFEADRVQHESWRKCIHHDALADQWNEQGKVDRVEDR